MIKIRQLLKQNLSLNDIRTIQNLASKRMEQCKLLIAMRLPNYKKHFKVFNTSSKGDRYFALKAGESLQTNLKKDLKQGYNQIRHLIRMFIDNGVAIHYNQKNPYQINVHYYQVNRDRFQMDYYIFNDKNYKKIMSDIYKFLLNSINRHCDAILNIIQDIT